MCIVSWGSREECLPSPPRCILNRGYSVHPCFFCFFNLELKTSVHQTLGSTSLWSSAYSNHFRTCCAGVLVVSSFGQKCKRKKKKEKPCTPKNKQNLSTSEVEVLVRCWFAQLQFIPKGKQENESSHLSEPLTILSQQHDKEICLILCWICSWFSRLLLFHFSLPEYPPACSLTWSWARRLELIPELWLLQCSIYFSKLKPEHGQEQGASGLSGESNSFFFIFSYWLLWMKLKRPWELPGVLFCQP